MMRTALGDRILTLRQRRNWTQGQLATYARVGRSWLSLVESGERERPNAEMLARVADALDVSVEYLLNGQELQPDQDKAAILRRLSRYPSDVLARVERMVGAFLSEDAGPGYQADANAESERPQQAQ